MTFAEKLKSLRDAVGLTQDGLADKSGVPLGTIREYEQGRRFPSMPTGFKLARALNVDCKAFEDCDDVNTEPAKRTERKKR